MKIIIKNQHGVETGSIHIDMNEFGHEICMGIRHGLYGASCNSETNIDHPLMEQANNLKDIANSLMCIADAINSKNAR